MIFITNGKKFLSINSLLNCVKYSRSKDGFKKNCKQYLMDRIKDNKLCDFTV